MNYLDEYKEIVRGNTSADRYTLVMAKAVLTDRYNELHTIFYKRDLEDICPELYEEYLELKEILTNQ